jgi:predicted anti-sigma-YlaC factor YlaD
LSGGSGDLSFVKCELVREAASAMMDGEATPVPELQVAHHLQRCPACAEWQRRAQLVSRQARVTAAPQVTDLVDLVLAAARRDARAGRQRDWPVRAALVAVAMLQLAVSVPILILGHDREAPLHVAHEMGAFNAALALGLLAAVWRPFRAEGMLPLVGAMALLLCVTAGVDLAAGRTSVQDEAPHLLCVVGWLLLHRLSVLSRSPSPVDAQAAAPEEPASQVRALAHSDDYPSQTGQTA